MFDFGEKNTNDAITLNRTTRENLPDLIELWNDGQVMKWVGHPDGLGFDLKQAEKWLEKVDGNPCHHHFVISNAKSGFCGEFSFIVDESEECAKLDVKIATKAQRRGVGAEALRALIRFIFYTEPSTRLVWMETHEDNQAAHKLLDGTGFKREERPAHLEDGPTYWELRRENWAWL